MCSSDLFGEEGPAQREAVHAADEFAVPPGLDAVRVTAPVHGLEHVDDRVVDPGLAPAGLGFGATADDLAEGGIDPAVIAAEIDLEEIAAARSRVPSLRHDRPFTAPA